MGNLSSFCRREEIVDFEDISDATFDFISVAVDATPTKTRRMTPSPSSPAFDPVTKIVAVVPMALHDANSTQPSTPTTDNNDSPLSFNDRLNMLTWDPETTPLPTPIQHDETYVFDEYAARPTKSSASPSPSRSSSMSKSSGWIERAMTKYQESKTRRRETKLRRKRSSLQPVEPRQATKTTTPKKTLGLSFWGKPRKTRDEPYQLPLMTSSRHLLDSFDDDDHFLLDHQAFDDQDLTKYDQDPISDTESDDSDATTLCGFYQHSNIEGSLSDDDDDDDSDSDSEFSDWTRSSSTSSCYFSATEDIPTGEEPDPEFTSTTTKTLTDYLCECGDCPLYWTIEREVTNSNSWMNETERRSLCRILQAHATSKPSITFQRDMIASAEECLLVFNGDEDAAFQAFAMLAQSKW